MADALSVHELSKTFQEKTIFTCITQTFDPGKIYGLVGPNGCGKTVFMKCLCGLLPVSHGSVRWGSTGREPPQGSFGVIIETPGFLSDFSGYANLKMLAGLRRKASKEDVLAVMEQVGLRSEARQRVGKYSLGMRQRLGIAQAILDDPPILLLDEPLNGLDQNSVDMTCALLNRLRERGKIILLASHHQQDIDRLCDKVFRFAGGRLIPQEPSEKRRDIS